MEWALPLQAMFSKVQVRISCTDMVRIADLSNTPKCRTPTAKTLQRRVCSAHRACRSMEVTKVVATSSTSHRNSNTAIKINNRTTMVDS